MQEAVIESVQEEAPKLPVLIGVGTILVMCFCVVATAVTISIAAAVKGFPSWIVPALMVEATAKFVLALFTRQGKLWAYYSLLVFLCIGIIAVQAVTGKPQVIPFLLFVLLVSNHKGFIAYAEYNQAGEQQLLDSLKA